MTCRYSGIVIISGEVQAQGCTGYSTFDRILNVDIVVKWLKTPGPFFGVATTHRHLELLVLEALGSFSHPRLDLCPRAWVQ